MVGWLGGWVVGWLGGWVVGWVVGWSDDYESIRHVMIYHVKIRLSFETTTTKKG